MVFEAGERPDLAAAALRAARKVPELAETPTIVALPPRQITSFDPASGFDDFIVVPCVPAEIYARIRALEWRPQRVRHRGAAQDRRARRRPRGARGERRGAPRRSSRPRSSRCSPSSRRNRGRVFSREALLARVWGSRYEGGRAHGGHPRAASARQARRRAAARDAARRRLQAARARASGREAMSARIAVSVGCPCGVGPEVSVVAAAAERRASRAARRRRGGARAPRREGAGIAERGSCACASPEQAGRSRAGACGVWQPTRDLCARATGRRASPTRASGAAQLAWIDAACDLVAARRRRRARHGPGEQGGHRAVGGAWARRGFLGPHRAPAAAAARARGGDGLLVAGARDVAGDDAPAARARAARGDARGRGAGDLLARVALSRARAAGALASRSRRSIRTRAREGCSGARSGRASRRASSGRARRLARRAHRGDRRGTRARGERVPPRASAGDGTASSRCTTTRRRSR